MGLKVPDFYGVNVCPKCHDIVGGRPKEYELELYKQIVRLLGEWMEKNA